MTDKADGSTTLQEAAGKTQAFIDRAVEGAAGGAGTTVDEIATTLHQAIDRLAVHANRAEQRIGSATEDLDSLLRKSRDAAGARADAVSESVGAYVNQHPIAALGLAFGAGLLVATLLRRGE